MGIVYIVYDHELHEGFAAKTFQDEVFIQNPGIADRYAAPDPRARYGCQCPPLSTGHSYTILCCLFEPLSHNDYNNLLTFA
jgi:hypothetical protein